MSSARRVAGGQDDVVEGAAWRDRLDRATAANAEQTSEGSWRHAFHRMFGGAQSTAERIYLGKITTASSGSLPALLKL